MTKNLFAYGTLLVPEIWQLVVGKPFKSQPATLPDFDIFRVEGGDFPGIVASEIEGSEVPGRIFFDLDDAAITRLDAYEDTFYERIELVVEIAESRETVTCDSYVVPEKEARAVLSDDIWTLDWFEQNAQESYLRRMQGSRF